MTGKFRAQASPLNRLHIDYNTYLRCEPYKIFHSYITEFRIFYAILFRNF